MATGNTSNVPAGNGGEQLERRLKLIHVYAICTGAMFSSGFFLLPGLAAAETGPSVPLAYLIAGVLVVPAMLSTAELSTAMPRAGGPYHFLHRSLGPGVAVVGAFGLWIAMVLKAAFALVGIGAYLTLVVDVPAQPVAIGTAAAFTALNILGARESARLQIGLVAVLLVVLTVWIVAGAFDVLDQPAQRRTDAFSPFLERGPAGLLAATGMVFVSYAGLLQVASVVGEVQRPGRNVPRGVAWALATATAVYVIGTFLMVLTVPSDVLQGDTTPVATAIEEFGLPAGTILIVVAALAAFASTGNAGIMSAARYPLALARQRLLWGRFARLSRFGTPTLSVLVTGGLTIGVIVAFDVKGIASLASAFLLFVFGLLNLAVLVLRRARVAGYEPTFRSPLHPWMQLVGIVTAFVLIVDMGLRPALFTGALIVIGAGWYLALGRGREDDTPTILALLQRIQRGASTESLHRLQERGPRAEDEAAEVLERAVICSAGPDTDVDDLVALAARGLAERLGVRPDESLDWLQHHHRVAVELNSGRTALHEVLLDHGEAPEVAVAWAADPGNVARSDASSGPQLPAKTGVVVAGPPEQRGRVLRIVSLLATQLCDGRLMRSWPEADRPEDVAELLSRDAARREGADPSRSSRG